MRRKPEVIRAVLVGMRPTFAAWTVRPLTVEIARDLAVVPEPRTAGWQELHVALPLLHRLDHHARRRRTRPRLQNRRPRQPRPGRARQPGLPRRQPGRPRLHRLALPVLLRLKSVRWPTNT